MDELYNEGQIKIIKSWPKLFLIKILYGLFCGIRERIGPSEFMAES